MKRAHRRSPARRTQGRTQRRQRGMVLLVSLLFLLLISVTAGVTVRSAASSEAVANSARTQALALQAAEAALLHCEKLVEAHARGAVPSLQPAAAPPDAAAAPLWQELGNWDGAKSGELVAQVPFTGGGDDARAYFRRVPECMAQYRRAGQAGAVVITARGFGPDVNEAGPARRPPMGAEVWLQSLLTLEPPTPEGAAYTAAVPDKGSVPAACDLLPLLDVNGDGKTDRNDIDGCGSGLGTGSAPAAANPDSPNAAARPRDTGGSRAGGAADAAPAPPVASGFRKSRAWRQIFLRAP